jgi:cytochrome c-type biogenesis protein CcmH
LPVRSKHFRVNLDDKSTRYELRMDAMNILRQQSIIKWVLLLLLLALLPVTALGQEPVTDDEVNAVAKEIYCPVCESTPLDVCPTLACADWRDLIRTQLSEGASREEIFDYFAAQYGDGVLANPPRRGLSLIMLWVLPLAGILLGLLLFARLLRGLRGAAPASPVAAAPRPTPKPAPAATAPGNPPLDDYIARVEREVGE